MYYRTVAFVATNDAHIGLFVEPSLEASMYEIVLGGWGNTKSAIRKSSQGSNVVEVDGAICDPDEYVTVTVSIVNGDTIRVALGDDPNANIFMTWEDPVPHWKVNYIAVMTGWGSTGLWQLDEVEEPREIPEKPFNDDLCL